ncbi:DNA polymerase III subunit beta [Collibacillus ludicampi]|uniref:Beta sliding clamp n=1 Tax=Collibacillus ludicampi TaxID=2771369 RepID=A0AAV4LKU4_9BACL|nr:DNA polymerase III subunit beta [Collibacillus ludicampi]GIM48506.1 DNA polymerase III subunit beta [Collibacillus ludicampi]
MKLTLEKYTLVEVLSLVNKAVPKNTSLVVLEAVEIRAEGEWVTFRTTNQEVEIIAGVPVSIMSCDAQVDREGATLVSAKHLLSIAKKLSNGKVMLETRQSENGQVLTIRSGKTELELNVISEPLPQMSRFTPKVEVTIPVHELKAALKAVGYAAAVDDSRPILKSIRMDIRDGKLVAVATDSHRLAKKSVRAVEGNAENIITLTPPASDLVGIVSLLPDDEPVRILANDSAIILKTDTIQVTIRMLEGTYPDTTRVIPGEKTKALGSLTMNRKDFMEAIERALIVGDQNKLPSVHLLYDETTDGQLKIECKCALVGSMVEMLPVSQGKGHVKLLANGKYILDALRPLQSENVVLYFYGELKPFLLDEVESEDIYLVLPIRPN